MGILSDAEWELIGPLLRPSVGAGRDPQATTGALSMACLHVLRRDMHERYGKVELGLCADPALAEQGVWDALLQTLVDLGLADDWHMIDGTMVRGHAWQRVEKGALAQAFGRLRGGFTCKVHARCDNQGLPVGFILTGGEASGYAAADDLMPCRYPRPRRCWPTRRRWRQAPRKPAHERHPADHPLHRSNRKLPEHPDYRRYKDPNRIKRMFGKLKQQRRIATRYDKPPSRSRASSTSPQPD